MVQRVGGWRVSSVVAGDGVMQKAVMEFCLSPVKVQKVQQQVQQRVEKESRRIGRL